MRTLSLLSFAILSMFTLAIQAHHEEQEGGIGVVITQDDEGFYISEVWENGPAAQASLWVGDRIWAIDGQEVAGRSWDEVWGLVRGQVGTWVSLTIHRGEESWDVSLERTLSW